MIPHKLGRFLAKKLGITELYIRLAKLEDDAVKKTDVSSFVYRIKILEEASEQLRKKSSKQRWIDAPPDEWLTWGKEVSGDAFIKKVISYNVLQPQSAVLEIGAGYGRLLRSLLKHKVPFRQYIGVDISSQNFKYLKETFRDSRISFVLGDFEIMELEDTFDVSISSLTFKHLYPSFEKMLSTVSKHLVTGGWIFFDLIEDTPRANFVDIYGTPKANLTDDRIAFIRHYSREEIDEILRRTNFNVVAYDQVVHYKDYPRLLVVARNNR